MRNQSINTNTFLEILESYLPISTTRMAEWIVEGIVKGLVKGVGEMIIEHKLSQSEVRKASQDFRSSTHVHHSGSTGTLQPSRLSTEKENPNHVMI